MRIYRQSFENFSEIDLLFSLERLSLSKSETAVLSAGVGGLF